MPDAFKTVLRHTLKQTRSSLSKSYQNKASKQVCAKVCTLEHYRQAKRIALYHSINAEIDLSPLWHSAPLQGKFCYFPILNEDLTLSFLPATPVTPFKNNRYGIPEPEVSLDLAIPVNELDLILMPLLAFDRYCTRLGMGAGYYDRTLEKNTNSLLVGIAYPFQRIDFIAQQPWDVPLDAVITSKSIYWRESKTGEQI